MHVSSGNMTRGYACTCAEGSGSAGNPACTHTPPSSSLQPGRFLGLHGSGDGGSNSCGRPGSTGGKGLCTGAAPGPAVGSQLANPCHPHKYELTSLTLGQELLALRQQTLSVNQYKIHEHCNKAYQGIIRILKGFRISSFENCCNMVKQITTHVEIEIKYKDHHILQKRTLERCGTYIAEYYSAIKKNEILPFQQHGQTWRVLYLVE